MLVGRVGIRAAETAPLTHGPRVSMMSVRVAVETFYTLDGIPAMP
jgi:hypothetical protein